MNRRVLLLLMVVMFLPSILFGQNFWISGDTLFVIKPDSMVTSGGFDVSNGIISDNDDVLCALVFDQAFAANELWVVSATSPYVILTPGIDQAGAAEVSSLRDSVTTNIASINTLNGITYITQTNHAGITNEQALDLLSNGLLKHSSGVVAMAIAGTDYVVSVSTLRDSVVTNIASINDLEAVTYIVQTNSATVSNEQALDLLANGIMKNNSGTVEITTVAMSEVTGKTKPFDAIAFYAPETNAAELDTLWTRDEFYAFDSATAETLFVNWRVPEGITSVDSVKLIVSTSSTAADDVAYTLSGAAVAVGETVLTAFSDAVSDTITFNATANFQAELLLTGTFVTIAAGDLVRWQLYRDISIANDEAGDVRFHHALIYYQ